MSHRMMDPVDRDQVSAWGRLATLVASSGAAGALIAALRSIILRRYGGFWMWFSLMCASVLVAVLVGLAVDDTGLSESQKAAVIGICAFVAEDILLGVSVIAGALRSDPIGTLRQIWAAIRGKEPPK